MGNKIKQYSKYLIFLLIISSCGKSKLKGIYHSEYSVNERFEDSDKWNSTHNYKNLIVPNDNYLLYVMSDIHIGTTVNLNYFTDRAIQDSATAMIMVGDLTDGGENYQFNLLESQLPTQDSIQSFLIAGNHDMYSGGWKYYYSIFGSTTYLFTVTTPNAKDLFICLDSGSGTLGDKQFEWLKNILNNRTNYRRCIIFSHDNLFRNRHTTSTNQPVEELYALTELCIIHSIDMIVTGHDHKRNVLELGNTTHITMDAIRDGYSEASFFKLEITNGTIKYNYEEIK